VWKNSISFFVPVLIGFHCIDSLSSGLVSSAFFTQSSSIVCTFQSKFLSISIGRHTTAGNQPRKTRLSNPLTLLLRSINFNASSVSSLFAMIVLVLILLIKRVRGQGLICGVMGRKGDKRRTAGENYSCSSDIRRHCHYFIYFSISVRRKISENSGRVIKKYT